MSLKTENEPHPPAQSIVEGPAVRAGRRAKPVKLWALLGVALLTLEAYTLAQWIVSGHAVPTHTGPTPVPRYMVGFAIALQVISVVAAAVVVYWFVVRDWRRGDRLSLEGLLVLSWLLMFWNEPFMDYLTHYCAYNAVLVNFGTWVIPTSLGIHHAMPEPILFVGVAYMLYGLAFSALAKRVMDAAKARHPDLGTVGLVSIAFTLGVLFDFAFEVPFMFIGVEAYPNSIRALTLFSGHYYQIPIYEIVFAGFWAGSWACLRYFRDRDGHTVAERGIQRVRATSRQKTMLRFLALCGISNVTFLLAYIVPLQFFNVHADPIPQDIRDRSYLMHGECVPSASPACYGSGAPKTPPVSQHTHD